MPLSKKIEWEGLKADGEYFDYSKADLITAENEMKKNQGETPSLTVAGSIPKNTSVEKFSSLQQKSLLQSDFFQFSNSILANDLIVGFHKSNLQGGFHVKASGGSEGSVSLSTSSASHSCLHHIISLEKGAQLDVIFESGSKGEGNGAGKAGKAKIHTEIFEIFLGEDSSLSFANLQDYSKDDWAFTHIFCHLGRFSHLYSLSGIFGGAVSRTRIENHMQGGHSSVESLQAFFCEGSQFADLVASTFHHVPDTTGLMKAKGALNGSSRSSYKGYIKIDSGARNTVTHQNGKALLLSSKSSANVMPALDVENNEVEAGHGAAVGELSEEEMTYLRSRGLDESESRALIVEGFFDEMISQYPSKEGRAPIRGKLKEKINSVKSGGKD